MKNRVLFSIITINLNKSQDLRKTLDSLRKQTFKNFEVIVVDGGSTDESIKVVNEYSDVVTKFKSEPDSGRYNAMNKGIRRSIGRYLLFLNPGDILKDDDVLERISESRLKELVYFGDILVDRGVGYELTHVSFGNMKIDTNLLREYALPHQATFFHSSVFKKYGKYDDRYVICGDQEYYMRLVKNKVKLTHLPITVSVYSMDGISSDPELETLRNSEKSKALDLNFGYPSIHFFTIVLNGQPFIRYHIEVLKKLPFNWHWHIIEGASDLKKDTAWSLANGAIVPKEFNNQGRSNDGTSEYIDNLKKKYPDRITIYRKPLGQLWDGKTEMCQAPLKNITQECLLWQIDADELWTLDQIIRVRELFMLNPEKTAAYYLAHSFFGENLVLKNFNTYGNTLEHMWLRTWKFKPGDDWVAHEPPVLGRKTKTGEVINVAEINKFEQIETESNNLIFQHFSYLLEEQLEFKEKYYGYKGAVQKWKELNKDKGFPILLRKYFDWVKDNTLVVSPKSLNINPIIKKNKKGEWEFKNAVKTSMPKLDDYRYLLASKIVKEKKDLIDGLYKITPPSDLEERVRMIETSKGWRLILLFRKIVNRILPIDSRRRKFVFFIIRLPILFIKFLKLFKRIILRAILLLKAFRDRFTLMRRLKEKLTGRKTAPVIIPPKPPFVYKRYEFIDWLKFANAGMQNDGNIFAFEYAITNLPSSNPIIEIGSFCGLSTNLMNFYLTLNKKKNKLFTCDKWIFEGAENQGGTLQGSNLKNIEYKNFVKDSYIRNTSFFSKNNLPYTIECFSDEFFTLWENSKNVKDIFDRDVTLGGTISFAYVDGNHSYEFAKKDFINCDRYLEIGGFILFDDSADGSEWGVCKVIDEIKKDGKYEVILQNPNYLLRKIRE